MVYREHLIEIWVNGKKLELESQKSLNLRFQNVLFNPEKITSTQAEYSFEFEIPSTPNNDKIFDYANNLSKLNKFHARWNSEVYADGNKIFEGSMTLNGYKNKMYKVNLVSVKVYSLEDIFGDDVMYDISGTREDQKWYIDFDGVSTMNSYNVQDNPSVTFPLISYGAFQKSPYNTDDVSSDYTSKFDLDEYNKWYIESFYPSLNMVETLRKCFEYKGYNVGGDLFADDFLKNVYMSVNLADGQDPTYNLGNPRFGAIDLTCSWSSNRQNITYTSQELKYPYLRTSKYNDKTFGLDSSLNEIEYNLSKIRIYDLLEQGNGNTCTVDSNTYMWQPNERCIVIPADGYYKVEMSVNMRLNTTSNLTAKQWLAIHDDIDVATNNVKLELEEDDLTFAPDFKITTPLEIQLVKNYTNADDTVELIKGKNNFMCIDGRVDNATTHSTYSNYRNFPTCFPHQKMGVMASLNSLLAVGQITPTKTDYLGDNYIEKLDSLYGYVYKDNDLMAYDPIVNPNFVMGVTSMGNKNGGGCAAIMKNGYSWSKQDSEKYSLMYNQSGYQNVGGTGVEDVYTYTDTSVNSNTYIDAPQCTFSQSNNSITANIYALVHFDKNDTLRLLGIHRDYATMLGVDVLYDTSATVNLKIKAATPETEDILKFKNYGYNSPIEFDDKLRLSNFLNKEKKISEWIQNVADAFNLEVLQNGNNVTINTKNKFGKQQIYAVDIDDRVNSNEAESSIINYPKSMAVKYKIDADEWGAENSVIEKYGEGKMNDSDWKDFIDSGYTNIMLNDDSYVTSTSDKNLQFSYTWYDNFNWYAVNSGGTKTSDDPTTLRMPVISKYSYMIDGYDYEESMKHDGYGLTQRFWFKPTFAAASGAYVWTNTYPKEMVYLAIPRNVYPTYNNPLLNLSYKDTEPSILTKYFNISSYLASNYVEVEVYLTPDEFNSIKNGCMVKFDSDLYYPVEIGGYDPSGYNPTTLKLMKKVV